nr:MAG TPA: hypothetical protein [Bacteriophage sp.]
MCVIFLCIYFSTAAKNPYSARLSAKISWLNRRRLVA